MGDPSQGRAMVQDGELQQPLGSPATGYNEKRWSATYQPYVQYLSR